MSNRKAFTLLEVLISIALLGIVIVALFSAVALMQDSNEHLAKHLEKAQNTTKATKVLYLDMMGSDGNITIQKDEFSRVCMEETRNSLYALPSAKVCWVVLKKNNTLARIEGSFYHLPLNAEERVEVDKIMSDVEVFDVYHEKDKILVLIQQKEKEPITFMLQGVTMPVTKKKSTITKDNNTTATATK